jgi:integrase/recombinase XerD
MSYRLHPTKNKNLRPNEPRWYQIEYFPPDPDHPGKRLRTTFVGQFENDNQAKIFEYGMKRAWRRDTNRLTAKTLTKLVPEFIDYYLNELERRPRSAEAWMQGWRNLEPFFGTHYPNHITPDMIEEYKRHRLAQKAGIRNNLVSKRTVQKELHNLSSLLKYAVEKNYCDPVPFKIRGFQKKYIKPAPVVPPTPEQIQELFRQIQRPDLLPLYQSIYYTGCRSNEIRTLKRKHVYLESGVITVYGKGGKWRTVPIVSPYRPILEEICKGKRPEDYLLISKRTGKPFSANICQLDNAAAKADIQTHISAHVLRKCFSTHCIHWGVDMRTLQLVLGHEDIKTTETYTFMPVSMLTEKLKNFGAQPAA